MQDTLYLCDRDLNIMCPKTSCVDNGGECWMTLERKYAQRNRKGEPIVAFTCPMREMEIVYDNEE